MSVVEYTTIGGGNVNLDKRLLRRYFFLTRGNVGKKRSLFRRNELKTLPSLSKLGEAADAWNLLSGGDKELWETAAAQSFLSGYNQFIQDKIYRIINSISGNASPNYYHQYKVGHLFVPVGAGHFLLRMVGSETISFPATLKVSRMTDLRSDNGGGEYLKIRFSYKYNAGGGELLQSDEISLPLSNTWNESQASITQQTGPLSYWAIDIEGDKVEGDLYFDNLWCEDLNGKLTKDMVCNRVDRHFNGLLVPAGVTFISEYPAD